MKPNLTHAVSTLFPHPSLHAATAVPGSNEKFIVACTGRTMTPFLVLVGEDARLWMSDEFDNMNCPECLKVLASGRRHWDLSTRPVRLDPKHMRPLGDVLVEASAAVSDDDEMFDAALQAKLDHFDEAFVYSGLVDVSWSTKLREQVRESIERRDRWGRE